jgi:hypothetical protein
MLDAHTITASTNPLNNVDASRKNPAQFDAGLRQNQLPFDGNNSSHLDTESNEDCLPGSPEADSPAALAIDPEAAPLWQDTTVPHERESAPARHMSCTASLSGVASGSSTETSGDATSSLGAGMHVGSSASTQVESDGSSAPASSTAQPVTRRSSTHLQHGIRKPKVYTNGIMRYGLLVVSSEPQSHIEALGDKQWKNAMDAEFEALLTNDMWHLVPPKLGANIIDCKWVYKVKRKSNGGID